LRHRKPRQHGIHLEVTMNYPSVFEQLMQAAAAQPEPQRLLFVFAAAELPDEASAEQRAAFAAGHGGTLTPQLCVDKSPEALSSFEALCAESAEAGLPWQVVFVAGLSGQAGQPPSAAQVETTLNKLVERVKAGQFEGLLALDRQGGMLSFH
jgi:hypothetical protein